MMQSVKSKVTKSLRAIFVLCGLLLLSSCQNVQTTQAGAVGVTRKQLMSVSQAQVDQQSAQAYSQLRQEASQKRILNNDPVQLARVQNIANRLIPHVAVYRADALQWKWEVNVFKSEEVNAFCMAGGKIAVNTGLIEKLQITDDELAAVMGHEIAHALREHVRERMSEQQSLGLLSVGAVIGGALMGVNIDPRLAQDSLQILVGLPHSRRAEVEADQIGLELSARAGFHPNAAITLWQKMGRLGGGRPPAFLSTHPSPESRSADLARVAQIVMPLYQQSISNQPKR
jgi:predicted Zn-dependent protease